MRKRWEIRNKDTEPIFLKTKKKKNYVKQIYSNT